MATILGIVTTAWRKLGIVAADEAMTAEQAEAGVDALNRMIHGWRLEGIAVDWIDAELTDDFMPTADDALNSALANATAHLLAAELSAEALAPLRFNPVPFKRQVQAAFLVVPEAEMPLQRTFYGTRYARY